MRRNAGRGHTLLTSPMDEMHTTSQMLKASVTAMADILVEMQGLGTPEQIIQFVWDFAVKHDADPQQAVKSVVRRHLLGAAKFGDEDYPANAFADLARWVDGMKTRYREVKDGKYSESWEDYAAFVLEEAKKSQWRSSAHELRATLKAAGLVEKIDSAPLIAKLKERAEKGDAKVKLIFAMAEWCQIKEAAVYNDDMSEPTDDQMAQRIASIAQNNAAIDTIVENFGKNGFTVVHPKKATDPGVLGKVAERAKMGDAKAKFILEMTAWAQITSLMVTKSSGPVPSDEEIAAAIVVEITRKGGAWTGYVDATKANFVKQGFDATAIEQALAPAA